MIATILNTIRWVRDNIFSVVVAIMALVIGVQKTRNDRLEEENEELEREAHNLEIELEATEVRSRPVSRDKSDILGRM